MLLSVRLNGRFVPVAAVGRGAGRRAAPSHNVVERTTQGRGGETEEVLGEKIGLILLHVSVSIVIFSSKFVCPCVQFVP